MKQTLIAVLLNALSLVGGHFYNRRWDRAVLFFVVLVLWGVAVYVHLWWRLSTMAGTRDVLAISAVMTSHWKAFGIGVLVLWAAGLIMAVLDAKRAGAAPSYRWTASGVIGAAGLSILIGVFLAIQAGSFAMTIHYTSESHPVDTTPAATSWSFESPRISQFVHLGTYPDVGLHPPEPPSGKGYLRGRFTYDGKPASGVKLKLVLNKKYETAELTTGAQGVFTVRLPEGEWVVNRLGVEGWASIPKEGQFLIVTGTEPKLAGGEYDRYYRINREGMKVAVSDQMSAPQLNFTIRKRIAITWPKGDPKPTPTTLAEGAIAWDPYPGAETYQVRIEEVRHESDSTTAYYPVTERLTDSTRFPLAKLAAAPGEKEQEYEVKILAFAKDGTLLSKSSEYSEDNRFVLTDKQQLATDAERKFVHGSSPASKLQAIRANNRRMDAIEVLLKDGLVDEAERLLGKVDGTVDPGKKMAISGYVMAKRGRCAEANKLFARAACVPDYYRAECPK